MVINLKNFLLSQDKKSKIGDFQDLDHIDGVAISAISANLYKDLQKLRILQHHQYDLNLESHQFLTFCLVIKENFLS